MTLLLATLLLSCGGKHGDSADSATPSDGGTTTPTTDYGTPVCHYDWVGAPCSTEWSGLYNCDTCGQSYTCQPGDDPWPLSWAAVAMPCECIDLATGALLTDKIGCEGVGSGSTAR